VAIVFWSFRIMVAIGLMMAAVGAISLYLRYKRCLYDARWFQRVAIAMGPSGFVAVLAGWVTTEVGRQPFTVYGLLRTGESIAPVEAPAVAASLIAFVIVYFAVFGAGTLYLLRLMKQGPANADDQVGKPIRTAGTTPAPGLKPKTIPPQ